MKLTVLAIAVAMYAVVIALPRRKAWAAVGAAVLIVALGVVSPGRALGTLVNWGVLMIYVGALTIAELVIYSRVPARVADEIVSRSRNVGVAIVAILVMTGLVSAFVDNVSTVLVMAPIALALSRKIKIAPTYFMIGLAVMANLQGTATLVGDPPSMIFASFARYGFNDFFVSGGRPSIFFVVQAGMLAGAAFFYFHFARHGSEKVDIAPEPIVSIVPTVLLGLMILGLAVNSFFGAGVSPVSGLYVMCLGALGLLWFRFVRGESRERTASLVRGLDWETIVFLAAIFVMVGAVAEVGLLEDFAGLLSRLIGDSVLLGFVAIIAVSVLISGFVDNVPYIIAMLPVAARISDGLGLKPELYLFAILVGSCLGGNLTPFGASANVVSVGILRKEGIHIGFPEWLRIGLPFTLVTTAAASAFLWLVWR